MAAKYRERADCHLHQARALTRVLVDAGVLADHDAVPQEARLHRLRLNWLRAGLYLGIAVYGAVLIVVTILAA